jgi:hypothetical protein
MSKRFHIFLCTAALGLAGLAEPVRADPPDTTNQASMEVERKPTNDPIKNLQLQITPKTGSPKNIAVPVSSADSKEAKAGKIAAAINDKFPGTATADGAKVTVKGLKTRNLGPDGKPEGPNPIKVIGNETGEKDNIKLAMGTWEGDGFATASAAFANTLFSDTDADGIPTTFTAGFITDAGHFVAEISATDLGGLTSGENICAMLASQLAPYATAHGVTMVNTGTSLDFTFDRGYTLVEAGVVFGSTSLSPGVGGEAGFVSVPEPATLATAAIAGLSLLARPRRERKRRNIPQGE